MLRFITTHLEALRISNTNVCDNLYHWLHAYNAYLHSWDILSPQHAPNVLCGFLVRRLSSVFEWIAFFLIEDADMNLHQDRLKESMTFPDTRLGFSHPDQRLTSMQFFRQPYGDA